MKELTSRLNAWLSPKIAYYLISLVFYISAFNFPQWCAEGTFLFFIPFFAYASDNSSASKYLFAFWTLIVGVVLTSPLSCYLLFQLSERSLLERLILSLGIILYYSGWIIIVYHINRALLSRVGLFSKQRGLIEVVSLMIGVVCLSTPLLRFFGKYAGCILYNPLVPLMARAYGRLGVSILGPTVGLMFLWLLVGVGLCLPKKKALIFGALWLILCISIEFFDIPTDFQKGCEVHFVQGNCFSNGTPYELFEGIVEDIRSTQARFSSKKWVLCFPESFFSFAWNHYPEFEEEIRGILTKDQGVVLGAYNLQGDTFCNCMYIIQQTGVQLYYKKDLVPGVEYSILDYFANKPFFFTQGKNKQENFYLHSDRIQPLICAELYLSSGLNPASFNLVILNDSWCQGSFFAELMVLAACLKACSDNATVLYSSYTYCCLLEESGKRTDFSTCYTN